MCGCRYAGLGHAVVERELTVRCLLQMENNRHYITFSVFVVPILLFAVFLGVF